MEYRILGPVEVVAGGRVLDTGGPLERALLARLLLDEGRAVSPARLIDDIWEGEPPESAAVSLRVLVSKLRKSLAGAGAATAIVTEAHGYSLRLATDDQVDVVAFSELVRRAREALKAGSPAKAAQLLGEGVALWRGPPFADIADAPFVRRAAARLEEERLAAIEDAVDARLALGQHAQLLSDLEQLCATHPFDERLWGQRMLALYRCGRQADALAAFRQLQQALGGELGINPSATLVDLERRILKHDPQLAAPPGHATLPTGVVTFMLTDIERSTELWEKHAAAMPGALERHDAIIEHTVAAAGGRVIKSKGEGDATLSVFQRASDAVRAAIALSAALRAETWPEDIALRTRVALHTGEAHERDGDYFGATVNRAARVRSLAHGGHVMLSRATAELVRDSLGSAELRDLGERPLRGLTRGEHVFELVPQPAAEPQFTWSGERVIPPLPEPLGAVLGGPFVGRDADLERLVSSFARAREEARPVVLLSGEPGIGKTRLAAEFTRSAHDAGAIVLYGRCDEESAVPFQPFVEALRRWVSAYPPAVRSALPHAAHLVRLIPEVGDASPTPVGDDPEVERYRFFDAVASTLELAAASQPLVLVLDDLHWADRPTLQLLRHVLRTRRDAGTLIIGTYRESDLSRARPLGDTLPELRREPGVERLRLSGLEEDDIVLLFERTIEHDVGRRGRELAHALSETTDGNPFFIEQVVGNLVETGRIVQRGGRTVLESRVEDLAIPEGVIEAVGRRLSRLSVQCNQALTAAAVLGRDFEIGVLGRMLDLDPDSLLTVIDEALDSGLVREVPAAARVARCSFAHALVAQALYSELSLARKQRLHLRAADAIETEHANSLDTHIMALARHLRSAGALADAGKAIDYSIRAMQAARRVFAFEESISHAEAAIELIAEVGADARTHARVLEGLGDLTYRAGIDYARGVSILEDALKRYEALGDPAACARIHAKLGRAFGTFWGFIDIPRALRHVEEAERLFGPSPDPLTQARLLFSKGTLLVYAQKTDAGDALAEHVRDMGRELGDEPIYSMATSLHAWCLMLRSERDQARALVEEAWQIADRLDHLSAAFTAAWTAGSYLLFDDAQECHAILRRELDRPRQLQASNIRNVLLASDQDALLLMGDIERARAIREQVDTSVATVHPLPEIRFEFLAGDWDRARRLAEHRVAQHRGTGNTVVLTFALHMLGDVLHALGAIEESVAAYQEAAGFGKALLWWGDWSFVAQLRFAEVAATAGDVATARSLVSEGEAYLARGSGVRGLIGYVERARGVVAAVCGDVQHAGEAFAASAAAFERHVFPFEQAATFRAWGRALVAGGETRLALEKLDAAVNIYRKHGATSAWIDSARRDGSRLE